MHVLVTGAGGFIGAAVCGTALAAGWRVTAVYRRTLPAMLPAGPAFAPVQTDLRDCSRLPARFDALVLGPAYGTFGQPAVLMLGQASYDLTVIDNTRGVTVDEAGSIGVQTIRPAADVRRSDMTRLGLAARDLVDGEIEFGGTAWIIKTVLEQGQELRLILIQSS